MNVTPRKKKPKYQPFQLSHPTSRTNFTVFVSPTVIRRPIHSFLRDLSLRSLIGHTFLFFGKVLSRSLPGSPLLKTLNLSDLIRLWGNLENERLLPIPIPYLNCRAMLTKVFPISGTPRFSFERVLKNCEWSKSPRIFYTFALHN